MTCSGSRLQAGRAFYRWPHARSGPGIVMLAIFGSVRRSVRNGVIPANAGIQYAAASRQGHNCLCNTGSPVECVAGHPRLSGPGTARMASFRPPLGEGGSARAAQRGATGRSELTNRCGRGEITPPRLTSRFARCEAPLPLQGRGAVHAWHLSTQRLKQLIGMSVRVLATRFASELCERCALSKMEGAGKAGCWLTPMARLQKRMQAAVTTGTSRTTGLPCAMALRLIRDLPGDRLDCPRHPRARRLLRI